MHEDTLSDERLMKLSAEGDSNSFESLIRRYARPLMTLINRMIGRHHRSEEAVSYTHLTLTTIYSV